MFLRSVLTDLLVTFGDEADEDWDEVFDSTLDIVEACAISDWEL